MTIDNLTTLLKTSLPPGPQGTSGYSGTSGFSGIAFDPTMTLRTKNMLSSGLLTGGGLTINGGDPTKFDLASGTGFIVDNYTDPANPVYTSVSWGNFTTQVPTYIAAVDTSYVYINSSGAIVQKSSSPEEDDRRSLILIGWIDHPNRGPSIEYILTQPEPATDLRAQMSDFFANYGPTNISGNIFSPNGANLKIDRSAGYIFEVGCNWINDKAYPNNIHSAPYPATPFYYYHRTGVGPTTWTAPIASTDIDPNYYDLNGVLTLVPAGHFTIQPIMYYAVSDSVDIQYGQTYYNTMAEAHNATVLAVEVPEYNLFDVFRGWLIIQQGTTDLSDDNYAMFISSNLSITDVVTGTGAINSELQLLYNIVGTGVQWGGMLSTNLGDNTKFDISAGVGYIINNVVPDQPDVIRVAWGNKPANVTSYLSTDPRTYVLLDSTGAIVQQNYPVTSTQLRPHL